MSDRPEGPDWWLASDGKWYPPELRPSGRSDPSPKVAEQSPASTPVDRRAPVDGPNVAAPRRWQGKADRRGQSGRTFPDLYQKAVQGSHLADNISVVYDDDRPSSPTPASRSLGSTPHEPASVASGGVTGATIGAPAATPKRRWRKGH
jgi:hypothetical protein